MSEIWLRLETQITEIIRFPAVLFELKTRQWRLKNRPCPHINEGFIVSLTTMPSRIKRVYLTIESLLAQTTLPEQIILYLAKDKLLSCDIPKNLTRLCGQRFEIRLEEKTLESYDKIIPAMRDFPGHTIVTCDDDKIYPADWLHQLIVAAEEEPDTIICHFAREIPLYSSDTYVEYHAWPKVEVNNKAFNIMPIGVGGILYPPNSLHEDCLLEHMFLEIAPRADDIWLKFMSLRAGICVRRIDIYDKHPPSIPSHWSSRLSISNIHREGNLAVYKKLMALYADELIQMDIVKK